MLCMNNVDDIEKMKKYYRTRDMINLLLVFPELSPVRNLTIVESEEDYQENKAFLDTLDYNRVDSLLGRPVILGVENTGRKDSFLTTLKKVKEKDPYGVLVLFNVATLPSERYARYAGISVLVDVGNCIYIDAVGKGFDGREVSKGICTHERYEIPWFQLRYCSISNFKEFQTYLISQDEYEKTREDRILFLESIGLASDEFLAYIPLKYEMIPDFIWKDVICNVIKKLEKMEDFLLSSGFTHFVISGHTEGEKFCPWQMFDKGRYLK